MDLHFSLGGGLTGSVLPATACFARLPLIMPWRGWVKAWGCATPAFLHATNFAGMLTGTQVVKGLLHKGMPALATVVVALKGGRGATVSLGQACYVYRRIVHLPGIAAMHLPAGYGFATLSPRPGLGKGEKTCLKIGDSP